MFKHLEKQYQNPPPSSARAPKKTKPWEPKGTFPFFKLPSELRIKILSHALVDGEVVDLEVTNRKCVAPRLHLFMACRQMYEEAYPIFYGEQTFRVFPVDGQYYYTRGILPCLPAKYRNEIRSLELRLGPGWQDPPKLWSVNPRLGLKACTSVTRLDIMIECDPSHPIFNGFRKSETFYTDWSAETLRRILLVAPWIREVTFNAYSSVTRQSALLQALLVEAYKAEKRVTFKAPHLMAASNDPASAAAGVSMAQLSVRDGTSTPALLEASA